MLLLFLAIFPGVTVLYITQLQINASQAVMSALQTSEDVGPVLAQYAAVHLVMQYSAYLF